jgi:hypothetical protein
MGMMFWKLGLFPSTDEKARAHITLEDRNGPSFMNIVLLLED